MKEEEKNNSIHGKETFIINIKSWQQNIANTCIFTVNVEKIKK